MAFRPGDVVLVPFPFTDLSTAKVRPAAVISGVRYQATEPDIVLAAITSQIAAARGLFDYVLTDWRGAGLRLPSAFKPVLATLDPSRVVFQPGALVAADWQQVQERLRRMLDL